jgi:ankyrin repeat protein
MPYMRVDCTIVAQACLSVLLHLDENITKDRLKDFPLVEYAAEHWVDHARFENVSSKVLGGMKRLFDPSKSHLSVWFWIYDPEAPWLQSGRSERPAKARATPLHYAAVWNIHDIATYLIVDHSQDVNAQGFYNEETPLHVSSRQAHVEIARVLLKHGADTEARDKHGFSPLMRTAQREHVEPVLVLLEHGADVNAVNMREQTPLYIASGWATSTIVQILLGHGADAKAQCWNNETPLHQARGEQVALLLLEHGADAGALDIKNRTPLHNTSERGRVGGARVLLEHGVDANAHDANNATPLHLASDSEYPEEECLDVVRLLIQYGSDIHARDDKGRTPFMRATAEERDDIMELLLEHGAEDHRV